MRKHLIQLSKSGDALGVVAYFEWTVASLLTMFTMMLTINGSDVHVARASGGVLIFFLGMIAFERTREWFER